MLLWPSSFISYQECLSSWKKGWRDDLSRSGFKVTFAGRLSKKNNDLVQFHFYFFFLFNFFYLFDCFILLLFIVFVEYPFILSVFTYKIVLNLQLYVFDSHHFQIFSGFFFSSCNFYSSIFSAGEQQLSDSKRGHPFLPKSDFSSLLLKAN